jgi:hypothetical protein
MPIKIKAQPSPRRNFRHLGVRIQASIQRLAGCMQDMMPRLDAALWQTGAELD